MQKPRNIPKQSKAATEIKLRLKVIFWKFDMPQMRYFIFILKEGSQKYKHVFQWQIVKHLIDLNIGKFTLKNRSRPCYHHVNKSFDCFCFSEKKNLGLIDVDNRQRDGSSTTQEIQMFKMREPPPPKKKKP